ncbi:hypothetical protein, partial [Mesorhizobium sp. M7A.F.Ca.CA.004.12.1.1]
GNPEARLHFKHGNKRRHPEFASSFQGKEPSMAPRNKPDADIEDDAPQADGPTIEQQDWDAIKGGEILPESVPENGDMRYGIEKDGDLPDEDDDNAYQDSDDALPDDEEEAAITRDQNREGPFDET